ncbi:Uncharacterized protein PECH_000190 [Penicillium ucsense]|uniref:Myb-like DNA-binding domain-containing protein n=1 Tax=Penicillium ucsense TaxID=2839758 RepID=A0A8J8WN09_9EURO|nr:Uncharacterized protein PECM_008517 [Penicillium ucsense]KAF7738473.1 Uncharacterized protein PECH_000190 [Penicillium ucsense]
MPSKSAQSSPAKGNAKLPGYTSDLAEHQENAFLAMCLRCLDLETKKVDAGAVAKALGYSNAKSAGNRFSAMRKKYNLHIEFSYPRGAAKPGTKTSPNRVQKTHRKRESKTKVDIPADTQQGENPETCEPETEEKDDDLFDGPLLSDEQGLGDMTLNAPNLDDSDEDGGVAIGIPPAPRD